MSQGPGSTASGSTDADAELQLPSLEGGRKASEVIAAYMKGLLTRSTKLSDVLTRMAQVSDMPPGLVKSGPESLCYLGR